MNLKKKPIKRERTIFDINGREKLYKFMISESTGVKIKTPKNNGPHLFKKEIICIKHYINFYILRSN